MKAKITFKGSDDANIDPATWGEGEALFEFPKGKAVTIDSKDEAMSELKRQLAHRIITKAQSMPQFEVDLLEEDPPVDPRAGLPKDYVPEAKIPVRPVSAKPAAAAHQAPHSAPHPPPPHTSSRK